MDLLAGRSGAVPSDRFGTFTDERDGQTYKTVKIGEQVWMAQNMNYQTDSGSYCSDDCDQYCEIYGRLYNWEAAKNACPAGYHLPTRQEWQILVDYAGGDDTAGIKLKAREGWGWLEDESNVTDEYGFSALPGGFRFTNQDFFCDAGEAGYWWTATEFNDLCAYSNGMDYDCDFVFKFHQYKNCGHSVRCIKDD
ncbi:hypothetical protein R80B4_01157 [Fibrobacteres bacterium R8-0-B4]